MSCFQQLWKSSCWKLKKCFLSFSLSLSLFFCFFFPRFGYIVQAKNPRSQTAWSRTELEPWQVGCITGNAHLCKLPRLLGLLLSHWPSCFSRSQRWLRGSSYVIKIVRIDSVFGETVRDWEASLATTSWEGLMDGSFINTLITKWQHVLLGKQLLFTDWCSEVQLQLSGVCPISKHVYTGVTAAFQTQYCFPEPQRGAM